MGSIRPFISADNTKQPNSRHCFVCGLDNPHGLGMSFYDDGPGRVIAEYRVPLRFEGYPGLVHGGIVASMLDEVLGRAAMAQDHNHFRMTAKMELHYRRPVPIEQPLRMEGEVTREKGRFVVAKARLFLPDGTLAVEAEGLLADLPEGEVDQEALDELGWRVYPDPAEGGRVAG